ncbi:uncharacterized protein LOC6563303 isoform X2 [Drosophila grimshawi]|uniref:uncharacterized protein LOC6563303 isoform X2 n=1 Tax=Drosophila grimshawi TaxID=7222 RepID=UPI001C933784|nr:uncharacterized protein LOC6563303 isoform X2 [Drosophila grimshawi]
MDRNTNTNTNDKRSNAACSPGRCTRPDKCIHLRSLRQQRINQASCNRDAETLYRMPNFKANGSDEDVFHDCLSISDSDRPREGQSFKDFASCQSNLSHKRKLPSHQHSSNDYSARCKASMSGNFDDPEAVRAALKRAENVTQMLLQSFEKSHKAGDDKHPCTATLEITARLIPDPKSARSKCHSQGRPVTVQMPLQFDPNTCQMITCQPIDEPKATDYPALMHMQDERQPREENGPSSVSKKMQTDKSYLNETYKSENMNGSDHISQTDQPYPERREADSSGDRDTIDPTQFSQTNTSYLYDIRSRPSNFVADQTSQTNLKVDIYKLGKFRYPTQYMRQLVDKNEDESLNNNADYFCSDHCGTLSQSKSQPSLPSKTLIQHSVSMNTAPDCKTSVPIIPMLSEAQRNPICNVDNATAFYSIKSEIDPNATSDKFCSMPSNYTADTSSVRPVVEQSSRDNATNLYSLESDIIPSVQAFRDADDATNVYSIESDNAPMAKASASTAQQIRDADDATNVYSSESHKAPFGGCPDNMTRDATAQPSSVPNAASDAEAKQTYQNPCGLPSGTRYFPFGTDENSTPYFSWKSAKCVKCQSVGPCPFSAQSAYDCERGNDNVTTYDSIRSGTSRPNLQCHSAHPPAVIRSEGTGSKCTSCGAENSLYQDPARSEGTGSKCTRCGAENSFYQDPARSEGARSKCTSCGAENSFYQDPARSEGTGSKCTRCGAENSFYQDPARSEGARSKCTSCGAENSLYLDPVVTSLRKIVFCPSEHCNNSQIKQLADVGNVYFDADKSTILTSIKSRGIDPYDCDETKLGAQPSECDGAIVPFQKSSLGNVDKTSSRSQSVMAKVTCLCSSEVKLKLGMLAPEAAAGPPFVRMEESCAQDVDIEPADPLLISRTLPSSDSCTKVVYMNRRDNFRDCQSTSDTSLNWQAKPQSTYHDVEAGDCRCYTASTSRQMSQQKPQSRTISYKSVEKYGVNQLSKPDFKSTQSCVAVPDFQSVKSCDGVPDFISAKSCVGVPDFKSTQSCAAVPDFESVKSFASVPDSKSVKSCAGVRDFKSTQSYAGVLDFKSTQSYAGVPDSKSVKSYVGVRDFKSAQLCVGVSDFKSVRSCAGVPDFKSVKSCATYTTCASVSKYGGDASMPQLSLEAESVGVVMNSTDHTCRVDDAKEDQERFYECSSEKPLTAYQSCSTECSNFAPAMQRIVSILHILSDGKDKSADRIVFIQQLFRELTMLLRLEEEANGDGDNNTDDSPPLTYEDCLEAVAAGKKPTAAAAQPKTKEQKERIECLDQMEKYLDKCFPLKKKGVPQTSEIAAFEPDPDFDPKRKLGSGDVDLPETKDDFFDVPSSSECQTTTSTYGDAKSTTDKSLDSEYATPKSRDSKSLDSEYVTVKSGDSKLTDYKTPAGISVDSTSVDRKSGYSRLNDSEAPAAESLHSKLPDAKSRDSKITDAESTGTKSLDSKLPVSDSPDSKTDSISKSPKLSESKDCTCVEDSKQFAGESAKGEVDDENKTLPVPDEVESAKPKEESEPTDNRVIKKSDSACGDSDEQLGPLTDRERLLCEHMLRRMCEMCGEEDQGAEEQTDDSHSHSPPCQPCVCCHCRALVCDNQCKTVSNTLDAIRYDPVAETKFFIDSIICDLHAMDHVLTKNKLQPKKSKPSPTMGSAPGESFPVTIKDVSSLGCRALYVRWYIEDCAAIGGYEIYVDGHLTNRFYSFRHEAGVVANVDVTRGHQIILRALTVGQEFGDEPGCDKNAMAHAHPEMLVGASRPWTPSVFFYEP